MRTAIWYVLTLALLLDGCNRGTPEKTTATPTPAPAATTAHPAPAAGKQVVFSEGELDQMVAPVALYPDSLLAQVLMAATYPGNVVDAVAWSKANPDAKGDAAVRQVANERWDPSVQSLVAFPQVLTTLGQDPDWVQRLGDAFLAQPDDVMASVQRLRHKAQDAGTLASNKYQTVRTEPAPAESAPATGGASYETPAQQSPTIVIEPSDPEVVYVPSYNPTTAYGTWSYPAYPPVYYPPSPAYYAGSALMTGMAFGLGLAVTDALWGDCDWGSNDVDINVSRYNNINTNNQISRNDTTWRHNSANREGVPYRDNASREKYGRQLDGADRREQFRGDDAQRAQQREQARGAMERSGVGAPAASNREARQAAQNTNRSQAGRDLGQPSRDATRDRAQASTERAQARNQAANRAQGGQRQQSAQRPSQSQHRQQASNASSRDAARRQSASREAPRNNAFADARSPSSSRSASQRGQSSSRAANNRGSSNAGRQVNRQSQSRQSQSRSSPQRQSSSSRPQQQRGGSRR